MEVTSLRSAATIVSSPSSPLSIFSSSKKRTDSFPPRIVRFSMRDDKDYDPQAESNLVPLFRDRTLSNDEAMGLVLSAASVRGWTTGSGMEGPSLPVKTDDDTERVSTFPWSLFTKSPRRRMRVAFTCNVCGQRTTRAINPHAYTDGTVFVQCCGCYVFHKLVDNLNLFHEVKSYVSSSSNYSDAKWDEDEDDDDGKDLFSI